MVRRLICLALFCCTGCFNSMLLTPTNTNEPVEQTVITDAKSVFCEDKVAVIDVEGVLVNARKSGMFGDGENPVALFHERLERAAKDDSVKAVVLRINTPGGSVTASDIMYEEVMAFRRETSKPVVACMMDIAASGGYYVAMACDEVYAHSTTVTGSIGVIMSMYNATGLTKILGVTSEAIKSGPNKDIGSPFRPMTDQEREIFQGMVDKFYSQFVEVVAKGRHLPDARVRALADGRVYTGTEALKAGLVDKIGYLEDALAAAKGMAKITDAAIVTYDRGAGYRGSIYASMPHIPSEISLKLDVPGLTGMGGAGFMYMWEPGVATR